jgi:FAD-dependent urate hydroxylase
MGLFEPAIGCSLRSTGRQTQEPTPLDMVGKAEDDELYKVDPPIDRKEMPTAHPLLIIGAGPFGLAVAADALYHRLPVSVVGRPMGFWRENMPKGMVLRSASDWHLDPQDVYTMEVFLAGRGLRPGDVEPLPIELYLDYAAWFQQQAGVVVDATEVVRLDVAADGCFDVVLDRGTLRAANVVVAVGLRYFANVAPELKTLFPTGRLEHSCNFVDASRARGKRCLIIGGRQSAFEWAALLNEAGASSVDVVHRHPSPRFEQADWKWATELAGGLAHDPTWYRRLPQREKDALGARMWSEGRLKVEPWLADRVQQHSIRIRPDRNVVNVGERDDGALLVRLDGGEELVTDIAVAAIGYRIDISRIPFVAAGNAYERLNVLNGCPVLDEGFQTNVQGLYATGALATQDFGPFFGFTLAARGAAVVIGRSIRKRVNHAYAPS